jgi:hypothetical protein
MCGAEYRAEKNRNRKKRVKHKDTTGRMQEEKFISECDHNLQLNSSVFQYLGYRLDVQSSVPGRTILLWATMSVPVWVHAASYPVATGNLSLE